VLLFGWTVDGAEAAGPACASEGTGVGSMVPVAVLLLSTTKAPFPPSSPAQPDHPGSRAYWLQSTGIRGHSCAATGSDRVTAATRPLSRVPPHGAPSPPQGDGSETYALYLSRCPQVWKNLGTSL